MVQKKSKIKSIVILAAVVAGLAILLILFPELPSVITDSLFDNNFRISVFFLILGAVIIESVVLSVFKAHGGITKRAAMIILAVSTVIGGALLIADRGDKYDAPYMFTNTGEKCLIFVYNDAAENYPDEFDGTNMADYHDEMVYIHESGSRDESLAPVAHFVIAMLIFAMGYMLLAFVFGGEKRLLTAFAAFPVGAAMVCAAGVFFIIVGIPFRRMSIILCGLIIFAALSLLIIKKNVSVDVHDTIRIFLIAAAAVLVLIWGRSAWISPDSVEKTRHGMMLAEYSLSRKEIFTFSAYGFIEPIIHCVAWKFGVDFLYSFYPVMAICSLGIIAAVAGEFWPNDHAGTGFWRRSKKCLPMILVTGISMIFLATNYEFATLGIWVLSNGAIGTYILLVVALILLAAKKVIWPLLFVFTALITTRVEGAVYIILLLALALGIRSFRKNYLHWCFAAAALGIFWNILQYCFYSGEFSAFWNPSNGVIVVAGAIALVILALISRVDAGPVRWVMRHYYLLSVVLFFLAAVAAVSSTGKFGTKTLYVFVRHFATSDYNNSAAFWSYLLLMLPLMVSGHKKRTAFFIAVVADYLFMTLAMLCLRQDGGSHLALGDSGRRIIQQIMPTAMLAVTAGVSDQFEMRSESE